MRHKEKKQNDSAKKNISRSDYIIQAVILLVLLLGMLISLNVIFSQVTTARWDLTQDGQFTLSSATKRLLDKLDEPIRIKVFLSKDMPAPDNSLDQRIRDLLTEFESAAHGNLEFEIIEPESKTDEEVAKGFGLRKVAISQRDDSQISMKYVFKGLTVIYRDQAETIPELRAGDNLEYLIAKSIVNLTAPEHKSVAMLTGFGGLAESPILRESMGEVFAEVFGKRVVVETSSVNDKCQLSFRPDALILLNLTQELTPCAQYAIEQAVFKGTSVAILQSPTQGDYKQPDQPRINFDAKINELIANTGVKFNQDLLLDREHNLIGTQYTEDSNIAVSLPALPVITSLDRTHPITQNLSAIILPFSGTLSLDSQILSDNHAQVHYLVTSSDESVARPSGGDIQVDALQSPRQDEVPGPHYVAVALQTSQKSRFDKKFPENASSEDFIHSTDKARYLFIPDGEFLFTNKIIGYTDEFARLGIHLFVNGTEWLIQDEDLIEIRNRALPQMIQKPEKKVQSRMIWLNVAGIPGIVILLMISLRLYRKRREKKIYELFNRDKK